MRQQEYNSESEQYRRQRGVGLNPDLNGIAAGTAAENDQPLLDPPSMGEDTSQILGNIANGTTSLLQNVFSLYSGFLSVQGQSVDNALKRFGFNESLLNLVDKVFTDTIGQYANGLEKPLVV